jgi:heme exporter protein D
LVLVILCLIIVALRRFNAATVLGIVAALLIMAVPLYFFLALPSAFAEDEMHISEDNKGNDISKSFFGSTEVEGYKYRWGGSTAWYLMWISFVLMIVCAVAAKKAHLEEMYAPRRRSARYRQTERRVSTGATSWPAQGWTPDRPQTHAGTPQYGAADWHRSVGGGPVDERPEWRFPAPAYRRTVYRSCPVCNTIMEVWTEDLPMEINCPGCGTRLQVT